MRIRTEKEIREYLNKKVDILEEEDRNLRHVLRALRRVSFKRELTLEEINTQEETEKKETLVLNEISTLKSISFRLFDVHTLSEAIKKIK